MWVLLPLGLFAVIVAATSSTHRRGGTRNNPPHWLRTLVPNGRITSPYGPRGDRIHHGVDIAAPEGSPIFAPMAGRVVDVSPDGTRTRYGNLMIVQLDDGPSIVLAHMEGFAAQLGARVRGGELLGWVGRTQAPEGPTEAPHVHVEVVPRLVLDARGRIVLNAETPARMPPLDYAPIPG